MCSRFQETLVAWSGGYWVETWLSQVEKHYVNIFQTGTGTER